MHDITALHWDLSFGSIRKTTFFFEFSSLYKNLFNLAVFDSDVALFLALVDPLTAGSCPWTDPSTDCYCWSLRGV